MSKLCAKTTYSTKKQALSVLNYIKDNANRKKVPVRAYYCKPCEGWHFTSQDNNEIVTYKFKLPEDKKIVDKINDILR